MSDKTELLQCPFCGGKAKVSSFPGAHNVWCENQPVKCGNRAMFTVEQWNTRAAPAEDFRAVVDEPVAEVSSKFGDPEAFGERELVALIDIQSLPYGTKLYRLNPQ